MDAVQWQVKYGHYSYHDESKIINLVKSIRL